MTTDTATLLATVREALWPASIGHLPRDVDTQAALAALDSLAAELLHSVEDVGAMTRKNLSLIAELERVKAERDNWHASNFAERQARLKAEARLDKALSALREIADGRNEGKWANLSQEELTHIARAALAEIEGEAT